MRARALSLATLAATLWACRPEPAPNPPEGGDSPATEDAGPSEALREAIEDAAAGTSDQALAQLFRDHWARRLERSPMFATELGVHDYDERLGDASFAAEAEGREARSAFLARARAIDPAALAEGDRVSHELFVEELEVGEAAEVCKFALWGMSPRNNPVANINNLPELHPVEDAASAATYLARTRQLAGNIDHRIEHLRKGLSEGRVGPADSIARVLKMAKDQVAQATGEWRLLEPLAPHPELQKELAAAIDAELRPALERFTALVENEILPKARDDEHPGVMHVPDGQACYEVMIRRYTTLGFTADEIHEIGLKEMKRINDEMRVLGKRLFGTKKLDKVLDKLRNDEALYFETRDGVREFAEQSLAAAKAAMPKYFGVLPKADCVVTPIPEFEAPFTYIAYYRPPVPDGSKPGQYFINTYEPTTRPRYEARVLALHEAIPGHHLQIAISQELEAVPAFRKHGGQTVFVEGWALYTERLGEEMGLYRDDLDRMGVLSFDAWRAGRLVVDTGIHAKGWSRQQAIDYLLEHTALAPNNIDNEVDRYITWPGQALAYKIGQLQVLALRAEAEKELGERFDLPGFHDAVLLGGAVSVPVLRRRIREWIESRRQASE